MRRHPETQVECVLADTHYPRPHYALDGTTWHDGLCGACHGSGSRDGGTVCASCNGVGFCLLEIEIDAEIEGE
ncbi:hypothetical protein [Streptomyces sp. VRA16 Mangrove soil]|uniref:hypothetical protein n=1 Tax=Streptomyces sp. VRA16 Mangrove soil TaxID=2817434 RepID=UPI001A9E1B8D|nr:hypothetical protein [Streptomyces sp. VRA16 Mangrove soil]MBO1334538.1 hypothetical protein [Streptomyces sp. VRA16 Mangrove soil]